MNADIVNEAPTGRAPRFRALDSLRGIAALTVVLSHFCYVSPLLFLRHSLLRLILGGHEAVILFFVLSGFVLSLQILNRPVFSYASYIVKRVTRIYIPYIVAFFIGLVCYTVSIRYPVPWAGNWVNGAWQRNLPAHLIVNHILFILPFNTDRIVPVFWSLVYEMRISLVIPLFAFLARRLPLRLFVMLLVALSGLAYLCERPSHMPIIFSAIKGSWALTLHYSAIFGVGVILAHYRPLLGRFINGPARAKSALALGVLLYFAGSVVGFKLHSVTGDFLYDWTVTAGVALIISSILTTQRFARVLEHPVLLFFGDISYSIYLLHTVILLTVLHLVGNFLPHGVTLCVALLLIIPIAWASYEWIERPSIALGAYLSRKVTSPRPLE